MRFYEEMIQRIAADADPAAVIEEIRIYANWVLVKTGKWSISTYFHNMPGFIEPVGMDTWMGDWIGRPARAAALELLAGREVLRRSVGMACLKSLLPEPPETVEGGAIELVERAATGPGPEFSLAAGVDISVECFARNLYNQGSMAVINRLDRGGRP